MILKNVLSSLRKNNNIASKSESYGDIKSLMAKEEAIENKCEEEQRSVKWTKNKPKKQVTIKKSEEPENVDRVSLLSLAKCNSCPYCDWYGTENQYENYKMICTLKKQDVHDLSNEIINCCDLNDKDFAVDNNFSKAFDVLKRCYNCTSFEKCAMAYDNEICKKFRLRECWLVSYSIGREKTFRDEGQVVLDSKREYSGRLKSDIKQKKALGLPVVKQLVYTNRNMVGYVDVLSFKVMERLSKNNFRLQILTVDGKKVKLTSEYFAKLNRYYR